MYKSDKFYLAICATPLGQNGNGGHTHNDKLGFELWIDGEDIVRDPGTYLYTPLPHRRNEFRSTKAHNVPVIDDIEQNSWTEGIIGLFHLFKNSECFVKDFGEHLFELVLEFKDIKIVRRFDIKEYYLRVEDNCSKEFYYKKFPFYSNGYGRLSRNE